VRFGQGFLFSAPRPVRAEALHGSVGNAAPSDKVVAGSSLSDYLAANAPSL
jgi:hypothetical protein